MVSAESWKPVAPNASVRAMVADCSSIPFRAHDASVASGEAVVAEDIFHKLTARLREAPVPVRHHADVFLVDMDADARTACGIRSEDHCGSVPGAVVADDQLKIGKIPPEGRIHRLVRDISLSERSESGR